MGSQVLITFQAIPTRWLQWGRFPQGDAADFLATTLPLLIDGEFTSVRGRPLSNAMIAGLWRIADFDLTVLSWLISGLCAAGVLIFSRVVLPAFGVAAGVLAISIAIDFLHEHIGAASTEPIGFALGLSASGFLISAAYSRSSTLYATGMFVLTLTFMYRVGAVLVLPLLLMWPLFALKPGRYRLTAIGLGSAAIGLAVLGHVLVARTVMPDSPGFVNAPKSWYAIIAMGDEALGVRPNGSVRKEARWVQIFDDYPGLRQLPIDRQAERFVEIVTNAALDRPLSVVAGAGLEYLDQLGRAGLFRFVDNKPIRLAVFVLFLAGLLRASLHARSEPMAALLFLAGLGQILSIPFLHGGENRVHIGQAGLMAATSGFGLQWLLIFIANVRSNSIAAIPPTRTFPESTGMPHIAAQAILPLAFAFLTAQVVLSQAGKFDSTVENSFRCLNPLDTPFVVRPGSTLRVGVQSESVLDIAFRDRNSLLAEIEKWSSVADGNSAVFYAPIDPAMLARYRNLIEQATDPFILAYLPDLSSGTIRLETFKPDRVRENRTICLPKAK